MGIWKNRKKYTIDQKEQEDNKFRFTKIFKREVVVMAVVVLMVTMLSIGSSYAVFTSINESSKVNTVKAGTLQITYNDTDTGLGNIINLSNDYPKNEEAGLQTTPYKFKIENTGDLPSKYIVQMQDDTDFIAEDNCGSNLLDKAKLRYSVNQAASKAVEENILYGTLAPGASVVYEIRVWIDNSAGNEVLGKHYHAKLNVKAEQSTGYVDNLNVDSSNVITANIKDLVGLTGYAVTETSTTPPTWTPLTDIKEQAISYNGAKGIYYIHLKNLDEEDIVQTVIIK